jgi:hypothetical protein
VKRTPLKPGKPLQRRTELRSTSTLKRTGTTKSRKASTAPAVDAKPKPAKAARNTGPTKKMRDAVLARDEYACQRCGRSIIGQPYSLQHLLPRGRGGKNTMRNLVTVCGSATTPGMCHDHIEHQERRQAAWEGWLVPNGVDPDTWPVKRFDQRYAIPGIDGWTPAEQDPLQAAMEAAA